MLTKKSLGIITALLGISLIFTSFYIKSRVVAGKEQINEAQSQVHQGSQLFSLNPITKEVGKEFTGAAQNKINEATEKANRYDTLAFWFQIGGAAFIVLGAGIVFIGRKK
jgi:hypothetical protein